MGDNLIIVEDKLEIPQTIAKIVVEGTTKEESFINHAESDDYSEML